MKLPRRNFLHLAAGAAAFPAASRVARAQAYPSRPVQHDRAGSPADFGKLVVDDKEKWAKVIRAANIKAE
jgi:hypothetical protein